MTTVTAGQRIGYDSALTIDRVCVPDSKVLSNAFNDYLESMTGALSKGEFANMVTDVKNVTLLFYRRIGSGSFCPLFSQSSSH